MKNKNKLRKLVFQFKTIIEYLPQQFTQVNVITEMIYYKFITLYTLYAN